MLSCEFSVADFFTVTAASTASGPHSTSILPGRGTLGSLGLQGSTNSHSQQVKDALSWLVVAALDTLQVYFTDDYEYIENLSRTSLRFDHAVTQSLYQMDQHGQVTIMTSRASQYTAPCPRVPSADAGAALRTVRIEDVWSRLLVPVRG